MSRIWFVATIISGCGIAAVPEVFGAEQPANPTPPPESGTSSPDLSRSGGIITPPADVDPAMKRTPPPSSARTPVIPPPGTPGGDQSVKPK
jgi:hypothetical protein